MTLVKSGLWPLRAFRPARVVWRGSRFVRAVSSFSFQVPGDSNRGKQ
jgi:hypothetical protein